MCGKEVLAVDLGGSSGKIVCGSFTGRRICLEEIYRFDNIPIVQGGHLCWDTSTLYNEIKKGIAKSRTSFSPISVSVDSWGQDFALIKDNKIISPLRHYRSFAESNALAEIDKKIPLAELYKKTGTLPFVGASLAQLVDEKQLADKADTLLFTPDYFNYLLSGGKAAEPSLASTSMMLGWDDWCTDVAGIFGVSKLLPKIVSSGTLLDSVRDEEIGRDMRVVTGAGHDTACAFAGAPRQDGIILSSGTWSLMGILTNGFVANQNSLKFKLSNQRAADGRNRFLKSFSALWLMQQCVGIWGISYDMAEALGEKALPFISLVDPEYPDFFTPGDMPKKINQYLAITGQPICHSIGEFVRCIMQSLALKYAQLVRMLEIASGVKSKHICVVGGGVKSRFLNKLIADSTGLLVFTGSKNSSSLGNCLVQLVALGEITWANISDVAAASVQVQEYEPQKTGIWEAQRERFDKLTGVQWQ